MTTLAPLLVDVGPVLEDATGFLQYLLVFIFAAIPVIEILVVVPIAVGLGLDPVATGIAAFAGNAGSVAVLVLGHRWLRDWWRSWRSSDSDDGESKAGPESKSNAESSDRHARARRLWDQYGLPGIALGGPILTGVHIAALVALVAGSRTRDVLAWMTAGIGVWTVALVAGSALGVSLLGLA